MLKDAYQQNGPVYSGCENLGVVVKTIHNHIDELGVVISESLHKSKNIMNSLFENCDEVENKADGKIRTIDEKLYLIFELSKELNENLEKILEKLGE